MGEVGRKMKSKKGGGSEGGNDIDDGMNLTTDTYIQNNKHIHLTSEERRYDKKHGAAVEGRDG